jgi:predicted nucleic acid-binding protein
MNYVLDSSVAFKWVVPEAHSDKALRLREDFQKATHKLLAPDIFPIEIGHGLTRAERQGRISPANGWALWLSVMADSPHLHPSLPLMPRAYEISSLLRIGIYDCLYVALAEREKCELVTADDKLVKNLRQHFPFIRDLTSLPP